MVQSPSGCTKMVQSPMATDPFWCSRRSGMLGGRPPLPRRLVWDSASRSSTVGGRRGPRRGHFSTRVGPRVQTVGTVALFLPMQELHRSTDPGGAAGSVGGRRGIGTGTHLSGAAAVFPEFVSYFGVRRGGKDQSVSGSGRRSSPVSGAETTSPPGWHSSWAVPRSTPGTSVVPRRGRNLLALRCPGRNARSQTKQRYSSRCSRSGTECGLLWITISSLSDVSTFRSILPSSRNV